MPRPLLFSEFATTCILSGEWADWEDRTIQIVSEYQAPPLRVSDQWFNTDFRIDFASKLPEVSRRRGKAVSIRRNTIGSELFYLEDEHGSPLSIELINGEAFPKDAYKIEIGLIQDMVDGDAILERSCDIASASFLRLFDLDEHIVFLASSQSDISGFAFLQFEERVSSHYKLVVHQSEIGTMVEGVLFR